MYIRILHIIYTRRDGTVIVAMTSLSNTLSAREQEVEVVSSLPS